MVDYQFLGLVVVVMAVVTRGSVWPVVVMTAAVAIVMATYEAGSRRYRRGRPRPAGHPVDAAPPPSDAELARWLSVVDRVLRSPD